MSDRKFMSVLKLEVSEMKYQMDALDGLRGLAALVVVFSHTSNMDMFLVPFVDMRGYGKSGVYLFFLLSSFLLTLPLLDKGTTIFSRAVQEHYWRRRFFRVYPLYIVYLLMAVFSTLFFARVLGKQDLGLPFVLDGYGLLAHLFLIDGKGVAWSIAVEFKFYFVLPVVILAVNYVYRYGAHAAVGLLVLLIAMLMVFFPADQLRENDIRLLPYMPVFLFGMLLAVLQRELFRREKWQEIGRPILRWAGVVGLVGVVVMIPSVFSALAYEVDLNYFHKMYVLYAVFWACILMSAVNVPGFLQTIFRVPLLRFFGAISFSLYLFHPIFIEIALRSGAAGYMGGWFVGLASTLAAFLSFKLLESPMSRWGASKRIGA